MTDFVDGFPDDLLLDVLGDSVTHISLTSVSTEVKAVIEFDVAVDEHATERQTEIELLKENFPTPLRRGEEIIHNSKTYKLDSLLSRDGEYERWTLVDG